jgi:hypothetical protein
MDAYVAQSNYTRKEGGWDRSGFIRQAVKDKLDHLRRSRKKRKPEASDEAGVIHPLKLFENNPEGGSESCGDTPRGDGCPAEVQASAAALQVQPGGGAADGAAPSAPTA